MRLKPAGSNTSPAPSSTGAGVVNTERRGRGGGGSINSHKRQGGGGKGGGGEGRGTGTILVSPLNVTAAAAESQTTMARKTVHGLTRQLTTPHEAAPQAMHSYVEIAMMTKTSVKNMASAITGHTTPFRTASVSCTASDTPWT